MAVCENEGERRWRERDQLTPVCMFISTVCTQRERKREKRREDEKREMCEIGPVCESHSRRKSKRSAMLTSKHLLNIRNTLFW